MVEANIPTGITTQGGSVAGKETRDHVELEIESTHMIDRTMVSQEVTVMLSKGVKVPKLGTVLKIEVIKMGSNTAVVALTKVTYVAKDGKSFSTITQMLKHDGTWSTCDDFANTSYRHKVSK